MLARRVLLNMSINKHTGHASQHKDDFTFLHKDYFALFSF